MNAVAEEVTAPAMTLEEASAALEAAKLTEAQAREARLEAEAQVLALAGTLPEEGTTRRSAGRFVVVVQTSLRRKLDAEKLAEIAATGAVPDAIGKRLLRWKPELDTRELRYVRSNEPEIYAALAPAIEVRPSKPTVRIEPAKQEAA